MLRKEHPRPIFKRNNWLNLNGKWSCEFSKNIKGFSKSQLNKNKFSKTIKSWGHGDKVRPKTIKEVYERMEKLTEVVLKTKHIQGFCYTQLTDVEQETNGVYLYDRTNKFNVKKLSKIFRDMSLKLKKGYIQ